MRDRSAKGLWISACVLVVAVLWLGCEQKGEVSPTGSNRQTLTFIDTVTVDPALVPPGGTASVEARILTELNEPAVGEAVRFSVNRGTLASNRSDTTLQTDSLGRARTVYTAPADTGSYLLRTELPSMSELRTTAIRVTQDDAPVEGMLSVWIESDSLYADNGQSTTLVFARLRNAQNNPIGNETIYFSTSLGSITSPATTDELTGTATAHLSSTTEVGLAIVTARHGSQQDTLRVMFIEPAAAASIDVTSSVPQMTAGQGSADITARVFDANMNPVPDNTVVFFSADRGVLSDLTAYTQGGIARTTLSAPTMTGLATVTGTTGGTVSGHTEILVNAGPPALIQLSSGDEMLPADNSSRTDIHAICTDTYGNFVSEGTPVSFECTGGTVTESATVGPNGVATAVFRVGLDVGPATILASNGNIQGSVTVMLEATTPASMSFNANPLMLVANGESTSELRALVLDEQSQPVSNGTLVIFESQYGQISGSSAANQRGGDKFSKVKSPWANRLDKLGIENSVILSRKSESNFKGDPRTQSTFTAVTVNGYATATLTSSTVAAHDSVSAACEGLTQERVITYRAGDPAMVRVLPTSVELPADGISSTTVMCSVVDQFNNPVGAGIEVRCSVTMGTVIPETGYTDESGQFTTNVISSRDRGLCAIVANSGGGSGYGQIQFVAPAVANVIVTANPHTIYADGASSTTITCLTVDSYGLPVSGASVNWIPQAGIGSLIPNSTVTDANGIATAIFTSGPSEIDAQQNVTCTSDGHSDIATVSMIGVTMTSWMDDTSIPADGNSTSHVNAQLRETASGIAIAGATVRFAATSGAVEQSAQTNASGVARALYQSAIQPATVTVTCAYGNEIRSLTGLQLTDTEASLVMLSVGANSLLANGIASTMVSAHVMDEAGQGVPNTTVTFVVTGPGSFMNPTVVTNDTGWAFSMYQSAALTNDAGATLEASIERSDAESTIQLRGVTVEMTSSSQAIPANGVSTAQMLCLVRETTSLIALPNVAVLFGTSLGSVPASVMTNASGVALAILTSGTSAGTAHVVCSYGNSLNSSVDVEMYAAIPANVTMTGSANSVRADGVSTILVTARVFDETGVALAGAPVAWNANSGQIQNPETSTNSGGSATATFRSVASTVNTPAVITAVSGTVQNTFSVTQRGVTVDVTATPGTVIADGSSSSLIRAHIFETSTNIAVTGVQVQFGATMGTIAAINSTDESGIADVTLTSSTQTGMSAVTASFGSLLTDQVQVMFAPSTPTNLSLTASPTVLLADNEATSTITAVVTDQNGNPVPNGTQVRFSLPPQSGSMENLRTTIGGVAVNQLTSNTTPGPVTVLAWAESNPAVRDSVIVTYVVGQAAVVSIIAQSDTLAANGIAVDTITAYVTDAVGHPLSNVEVRFSANIGNIASSRSTDGTGHAAVAFSSSQTGTATITAMADSIQEQHTVYLIPGGPNSIQLSFNPGSVGVRGSGRNETLLVTATVRDVHNNTVIDGTPVFFNINNSPGGGDFLSSNGPIPTINGQATVSYNSGTVSGTARVRALCQAISAVSTEILVYAGPPYIENIADGCNTSHMSAASSPCSMFGMDVVGDSVEVLALVGDRYNNPVTPGTAVYFTTSGGVITTSTGYTDSMGFARVTLWSGNPLPTIPRWMNTLMDPNTSGPILCSWTPTQDGMAKVLVSSAGVDANGDSVSVWSSTNVRFEYAQPLLYLRNAEVNGDPEERELFIGQNALITIAAYDPNYWPMVAGSTIRFSASEGRVYPAEITVGCPGDTSYTVSFFNDLTLEDTDAATPVLVEVDTRYGDAFTFTETFTLRALLPSD